MSSIKNIIFDLGGVIIDLDINKTDFAFRQLLQKNDLDFKQGLKMSDVYTKLEVNKISPEEFMEHARQLSAVAITDEQIRDAWNAMLIGIPAHRLTLLKNIRQHYKIYLLSNTNVIHLNWVYEHLQTAHNISDWDSLFFERSYYSHLIELRKPNANCYEFVLNDAGILAEETLFIDDNEDNIDAAKALGIQTYLHNPKEEIEDVLKQILIRE